MQPQKPAVIEVKVQTVRLEDLIDVRHQVLRNGQPRSSCYYPEDGFKHTLHFGLFISEKIIGCASIYKESHPDFRLRQSWRIRGMAVLEEYQSNNYGSLLLNACINHAIGQRGDVIWCNARINAVAFYKKKGFKIIGDEFEIENIGPHFLMAKNLGIHSGKTRFLELVKHLLSNKNPIPVTQNKLKQ
jgi:ribosomal protein S18 acetylase RimI-like enzyme